MPYECWTETVAERASEPSTIQTLTNHTTVAGRPGLQITVAGRASEPSATQTSPHHSTVVGRASKSQWQDVPANHGLGMPPNQWLDVPPNHSGRTCLSQYRH